MLLSEFCTIYLYSLSFMLNRLLLQHHSHHFCSLVLYFENPTSEKYHDCPILIIKKKNLE